MFKSWLKVYRYHWFKHKLYFVLTVLGLVLGLSISTVALLSYQEEHEYDQWNPNKDKIFLTFNVGPDYVYTNQSFVLGRTVKENYAFIEDYLYYVSNEEVDVQYGGKKSHIDQFYRSQSNFFEFFPYPFVYGSATRAFDQKNSVVLEENEAIELFGKGVNPMGKQLLIEEKRMTVSGVFSTAGKKGLFEPKAVISILDSIAQTETAWENRFTPMLIKTSVPTKAQQAIEEVLTENYYAPMAKASGMSMEELRQTILDGGDRIELAALDTLRLSEFGKYTPGGSANLKMLYIFWGLALLLLILSIINFINFSITQFLLRLKELGIRRICGASKKMVMQQIYFETALTIGLGLLISIAFAEFILPYVNLLVEVQLKFTILQLGLSALFLFVILSLFTGSIIAFYVIKQQLTSLLKGNVMTTPKGGRIKNVFLILQFGIAFFFVISTLVVNQQVHYMLNKDLGFRGDQIISFSFNQEMRWRNNDLLLAKYQVFKEEVSKINGVERVAASDQVFGRSSLGETMGSFEGQNIPFHVAQIDYDYFDLFQIPLTKGRNINPLFSSDTIQKIVVNEAFTRAIGYNNPVGHFFDMHGEKKEIIGVVKDFNSIDLQEEIKPISFHHINALRFKMGSIERVYVKVAVGKELEQTVKAIEKLWHKLNLDTDATFQYEFVDKEFQRTFDQVLLEQKVFNSLNVAVVFIALFGLFAIASFTVHTRLKEIAIRKVLGANPTVLLKKITRQYVIYCGIGFVLAVFPSYYFLEGWLSSYAYRVEIGWEIYGISLVGIVILTLCIVLQKARKAVQVDVLKYIKYE